MTDPWGAAVQVTDLNPAKELRRFRRSFSLGKRILQGRNRPSDVERGCALVEVNRASRARMNRYASHHFVGDTLFARLGRAVCAAEAIPRKEFFETWEVAKKLRHRLRGRPIVELAAGHGFLSALLILFDDAIPSATCVDLSKPLSHERLYGSLIEVWPRLEGRVGYEQCRIEEVAIPPEALVVSVHACGTITDLVLDRAIAQGNPVAVVPCCHDFDRSDDGGLTPWMEPSLAIDAARAARLANAGYRVVATTIPEDITPRNRLLIGLPPTA